MVDVVGEEELLGGTVCSVVDAVCVNSTEVDEFVLCASVLGRADVVASGLSEVIVLVLSLLLFCWRLGIVLTEAVEAAHVSLLVESTVGCSSTVVVD